MKKRKNPGKQERMSVNMEQKLNYLLCGDYFIPEIQMREIVPKTLGKYGRMRRAFLKEHRPILYQDLVLTEELFPHLYEVDELAHQRLERIETQLLKRDPGPAKAADQMAWVRHRNMIRAQAEEFVLAEVVYA